jgi:hypothetical protein
MTFAYTYEDPEYQREEDEAEYADEPDQAAESLAVEAQDDRPLYIWLR